MLTIGLTGGIASGKSTACQYFESLGIRIIDADIIAKQLVLPRQPALQSIISRFGKSFLKVNQELDRKALAKRIFSDKAARLDLEAILHPLIHARMKQQLAHISGNYCILAIPLLIETAQYDLIDRILLIDINEILQYQRLKQRDQLDDEAINAILQSQATPEKRLSLADDVVSNNGSAEEFHKQLQFCHQRYQQISTS